MKKNVIRLEATSEDSNFNDYWNFVFDSYLTDVWVFDWEADQANLEIIIYSVNSEEENVKDFIEQTAPGCNFKIAFYKQSEVSPKEWQDCIVRLELDEDEDFELMGE